MKKVELFTRVIDYFDKYYPTAKTELKYDTPFQLLVAVILSAQCTDKRVNTITPKLFKDYPTPNKMKDISKETIFSYIRSCSYPNNKAKYLVEMSKKLAEDHNSIIPSDLEELLKLPGVGRKTANVIGAVLYNKYVMPVDTHVFRLSKRIGLATLNSKTPLDVEKQLVKHFPKEILPKAHHWLILYGRYVCKAKSPLCQECGIKDICRFYKKKTIC